MKDNIEVIEEDYGKTEDTTKKQIVLRQVERIAKISCKELTPSYWQTKPIKVGDGVMMSKVYHEDLREAYCNAVDCLFDLVSPETEEDKETFGKKLKELNEEEDKKFKDAKNQDTWIIKKQKLRRKLFREIILLFDRINYFESEEYHE